MADKTGIEWTDATWNPLRGCTRVSEGCRNCYAETTAVRFSDPGAPYHGLAERGRPGSKWTGKVDLIDAHLLDPLRWKRPRRIFVNSMSDLFHEKVPDEWIDRIFAVMALEILHTFQVLTKRAERMRDYLAAPDLRQRIGAAQRLIAARATCYECVDQDAMWPLPNVWLGVSTEHQAAADERIPLLLATPAAKRFISAEPLLGSVDLTRVCVAEGETVAEFAAESGIRRLKLNVNALTGAQSLAWPVIDWVIAGGESGANARPMHPDWARSLRDQCAAAGVPFFFKQWGEWSTVYDRDRDDPDWQRCPRTGEPGARYVNLAGGHGFHGDRVVFAHRVGKKAAGRLLDGAEWSQFP